MYIFGMSLFVIRLQYIRKKWNHYIEQNGYFQYLMWQKRNYGKSILRALDNRYVTFRILMRINIVHTQFVPFLSFYEKKRSFSPPITPISHHNYWNDNRITHYWMCSYVKCDVICVHSISLEKIVCACMMIINRW